MIGGVFKMKTHQGPQGPKFWCKWLGNSPIWHCMATQQQTTAITRHCLTRWNARFATQADSHASNAGWVERVVEHPLFDIFFAIAARPDLIPPEHKEETDIMRNLRTKLHSRPVQWQGVQPNCMYCLYPTPDNMSNFLACSRIGPKPEKVVLTNSAYIGVEVEWSITHPAGVGAKRKKVFLLLSPLSDNIIESHITKL